MTRIDFHSNVPDKIGYVCRLVRKARFADCNIVVLASNRSHLNALDKALWTFSELDFLPHVFANDPLAAQTPVVLTDNDGVDLPHHQILINLSDAVPDYFSRFERMFEIISMADNDKLSGRERYRFYQQHSYPLTHFIAEKT
jgi:DNA polymerase III subunit chi